MLVVPITRKLSWRRPPVVTLLLILINVIVLYGVQRGDDAAYRSAINYYFESGLAAIEIPRYLEFVGAEDLAFDPEAKENGKHYRDLESNADFLRLLSANQVIVETDAEFKQWKELRGDYEEMLSKVVFLQYGLRPEWHRPVTFITSQFLHGGTGHLIGNMIFLWLVGAILEAGLGWALYSVLYLSTGVCAGAMFWLAYPHSTIPLVGASGAIAGLMGLFTTMYGTGRIKVFFSLGFYFNIIVVPAFLLFPLWVGKEVISLYTEVGSNVAYMAHIGGLLSGALAGFLNRRYFKLHDENIFSGEEEDEITPLVEKALQHLGKLETEEARKLLVEALEKEPENREVLTQLFNLDRQQPSNGNIHKTAARFLRVLCSDAESRREAHKVFRSYIALVSPRLSPGQYANLATVFVSISEAESAEKIISMLLKHKPDHQGLAGLVMKLAQLYGNTSLVAKQERCLKILAVKFADTREGEMATRMLQKKSWA